ncbi:FkbM family methyltransferase [Anabaena sp. CCY 9910]|uniref:FkbM family methyltransferase n=1 Tax=Anabaena sp. CCY 9910 TaxID=3103870 RepID=UPI0039E1E85E
MTNKTTNSDLNNLIPPEIKNDEFYRDIQNIARNENIKTVLEIGSSSGEGSTEAFVTGMRQNPNKPILFCMEVSKARFNRLKNRYKNEDFVKVYNISSVSVESFPDEQEIIDFYHNTDNNLKLYPLERVLNWLHQDIEYVKESGYSKNGIRKIKQENNIDYFDVVLIDGSEFTGTAELEEVYGAKYILLDDVTTFKNYKNHQKLLTDKNYELVINNNLVRNGYSIFRRIENIETYFFVHEMAEQKLVSRLVKPGMIAFDVGANIGDYSVLFSKLVGSSGRVYSFEPTPNTFNKLQARLLNLNFSNVSPFQKAIFSHNTQIEFNEFPDEFSAWNSIGVPQMLDPQCSEKYVPIVNTELVEAITIDSFCKYNNIDKIDYLKIDVEGAESDVLQGTVELLKLKKIGFIQFEISQKMLEGLNRNAKSTFDILTSNGYECHRITLDGDFGEKVINSSSFYENYIAFPALPIHFFTIVINGEPFIRYHIDIFKQLPFKWHWHIVEGVADLKHDTSWSVQLGGYVSDEIHKNGRSCDDTTEYIDKLAKIYPDNITIYRKPEGVFWDGKQEMVNAPLPNIREECLLWQVDVDEIWTLAQICTAREMFISNPSKTSAFYWCWYFVGEKLIISTRNCYAQNPQQEWLRTWRFKPGYIWASHEPPILVEPLADGQYNNVASTNPFLHQETEAHGLVFQHFAYVTQEQLSFKEKYYGYKNAVDQWICLQNNHKFPILLREYFPWVKDDTQVNIAYRCGVVPIAQKDNNSWQFLQPEEVQKQIDKISKPSPIIIIDGVFFQLYRTGIARVWKSLLEEWARNGFSEHIIVLDRGGSTPKISGIKYLNVALYDYNNTDADREMLQQICDEEDADLFISSYYTTPITTPSVFMAYDMIPEVLGWDLRNPMWKEKHRAIQQASAYIAISHNTAHDLTNYFKHITVEAVTVAHCGVNTNFLPAESEEINIFKTKYGITKPYFLLVGVSAPYKNLPLFLQSFSQLANSYGFDIILTANANILTSKLRTYTLGSIVHTLQLDDEELAIAYSGAVALVYPSIYEGFGMPLIEAMACACPVITCPNSSIPEVAGNAAIYVNHDDVEGLADALCEVQKPHIRKTLIAAGLAQAKKFSWSTMAKTVSSALIDASILHFNLNEINLIAFPDWSQSEELIRADLEKIVKTLATYPTTQKLTLIIDTTDINIEDAAILISSVVRNLLMEEDLDINERLKISLLGDLADIQLKALVPHINARIILENESKRAVANLQRIIDESTKTDLLIGQFKVDEFVERFQLNNLPSNSREKYKKDIFSQSDTDELCLLRRQISESLLNTQNSQLENLYLSKYTEVHKSILNNGVKHEPLTENEQIFVNRILEKLAKEFDEFNTIQYLLAAMLYCCPHQLPLSYELNQIPCWLLSDFLQFTLKSPLYFQEIGEIDKYYQYIEHWINYLHTNILNNILSKSWQSIAAYFANIANFTPLYFNKENLRDIYTKRADVIELYLQQNGHSTEYSFSARSPERTKIRLGIIASHFLPHTETFATLSLYKYLSRDLFEVILITEHTNNHRLERHCVGHADAIIKLPEDLVCQVQTIRELDLDILFIATNITAVTNQITLLSLHRLARIQIVDANSPVTTGMRHIDYYISSQLSETQENAQQHYREKLITLDCPPQCFDFATEEQIVATENITRESFGIDRSTIVYASGANYYKIIPEQEVTWAKIIASVPNSVLLLYPFNPNWSSSYPCIAFRKRIVNTFAKYGLSEDRLLILEPAPNRADVKERLKLSDIYLDSYPYSGMTSLIDPLEVALPTVIMEAEPSRSRKAASLLRQLEIFDLITDNEADYIQLAVTLGNNTELRQQKSSQIKTAMQSKASFLDSRSYSAKIGTLFQELFSNYIADSVSHRLPLGDINLIIFPDWSQPEELIRSELKQVIKTVSTHPDSGKTMLMINIINVAVDYVEPLLSSITNNLLTQEGLDVTERLEIALVESLGDVQWKALLSRLHGRIVLEHENKNAIRQAKAETLLTYELETLTQVREE